MKVKDLLNWFGENEEVYFCVVKEDLRTYLEQQNEKLTVEEQEKFEKEVKKLLECTVMLHSILDDALWGVKIEKEGKWVQ